MLVEDERGIGLGLSVDHDTDDIEAVRERNVRCIAELGFVDGRFRAFGTIGNGVGFELSARGTDLRMLITLRLGLVTAARNQGPDP